MDKMKNEILADFKILDQTVNGEPLVYLDNAATTVIGFRYDPCISECFKTFYVAC